MKRIARTFLVGLWAITAVPASTPALASGLSLLNLASGSSAKSTEPDYTWLRLFGMWHDQLTPTGYALGAGAKIDPSPKVTLAIDAEVRLQRENLNGNADAVSNDLGMVFPLTLQYTVLGNHRSRIQPFVAGGGYYTASEKGGSEVGWLAVGGVAFNLGTEVLAIDCRYYSDTYVTDNPDTHHYAARLSLWFLKPETKASTRSTNSTVRSPSSKGSSTTGSTSDESSKKGKKRY